jgi:hypothetical protein
VPDLPLRSKRAQILRKVLDYINFDDFEEEGLYPFMIFGKDAFEDWLHDRSDTSGQDDIADQARELASDVRRRQGELRASDRTSVAGPPPAKALRGTDVVSHERSLARFRHGMAHQPCRRGEHSLRRSRSSPQDPRQPGWLQNAIRSGIILQLEETCPT